MRQPSLRNNLNYRPLQMGNIRLNKWFTLTGFNAKMSSPISQASFRNPGSWTDVKATYSIWSGTASVLAQARQGQDTENAGWLTGHSGQEKVPSSTWMSTRCGRPVPGPWYSCWESQLGPLRLPLLKTGTFSPFILSMPRVPSSLWDQILLSFLSCSDPGWHLICRRHRLDLCS